MNLSIRDQLNAALASKKRDNEVKRQLALKAAFAKRVQARRVRVFNRMGCKSTDVRRTVAS